MSDQRKNKVWHFEKVNIVLATMSVGKLNRFPFVDSRFKKTFALKGDSFLSSIQFDNLEIWRFCIGFFRFDHLWRSQLGQQIKIYFPKGGLLSVSALIYLRVVSGFCPFPCKELSYIDLLDFLKPLFAKMR